MTTPDFPYLACPLDGLKLEVQGKSVLCANGHCFDFDRKGVLNLLPVQFKKSLEPGDSPEMVLARQNFLDGGFYKPIADALIESIRKYGAEGPVIFDAGCGEGYYTAAMTGVAKQIAGMDISKPAIAAAAKRSKDVQWLVGTNAKIPLLDQSVDIVTSLFGFAVWPEFKRILKPGGIVIAVDPGADHLIEIRRVLYPEIKVKEEKDDSVIGFEKLADHGVTVTRPAPEKAMLHDLIMMTPHGYRSDANCIQQALELQGHDLTIDVVFRIYRVVV